MLKKSKSDIFKILPQNRCFDSVWAIQRSNALAVHAHTMPDTKYLSRAGDLKPKLEIFDGSGYSSRLNLNRWSNTKTFEMVILKPAKTMTRLTCQVACTS